MKYPLYLHFNEETSMWGVSFPDFPGCISADVTLDKALLNAREALLFHIEGMKEDGDVIPQPSIFEDMYWIDINE